MRSVSHRGLLLALSLSVGACNTSWVGRTDNKPLIRAIEDAWNGERFHVFTGDLRFVDLTSVQRSLRPFAGEDALGKLPLYRVYANKGFITIANERDLTNGSAGQSDVAQLIQSGIRRTAHIELTAKGRAAGEVNIVGNTLEQLLLPLGHAHIEEVVANDSLMIGADHYRVVMGTHTYEVPDDVKGAYEQTLGDHLGRERRFRALLKCDAFTRKWRYMTADIGPRDGDFSTDVVNRVLTRLRLCQSLQC